jgi:hypothetical protein
MTVLLSRPYLGLAAGTIATLPASTEQAIVAQGLGSVSAAVPTAGAFTTSATRGYATIAAAAASVVITNPNVDATSIVGARVAQTTADGTLTSIVRVVPAAGSFTIFGNAAATAATVVSWDIVPTNPIVSG